MNSMNWDRQEKLANSIGRKYEELNGWFTEACEALAKAAVETYTRTAPEPGTEEFKVRRAYLDYSLWFCAEFFLLRSSLEADDVLVFHDCENFDEDTWVLEFSTPKKILKYVGYVDELLENRIDKFRNVEIAYLDSKFESSQ